MLGDVSRVLKRMEDDLTLKNDVTHEETPCTTHTEGGREFGGYFCWRIGEVADKLPISRSEKEDEDDIDEEKEEISEKEIHEYFSESTF